jgi:hypothetical protein
VNRTGEVENDALACRNCLRCKLAQRAVDADSKTESERTAKCAIRGALGTEAGSFFRFDVVACSAVWL